MVFVTLLAVTFIAITISNVKTVFTIGSKAFATFMKVPVRTISPRFFSVTALAKSWNSCA
jgi:hypothetical protein